jgi:hypothetical protein
LVSLTRIPICFSRWRYAVQSAIYRGSSSRTAFTLLNRWPIRSTLASAQTLLREVKAMVQSIKLRGPDSRFLSLRRLHQAAHTTVVGVLIAARYADQHCTGCLHAAALGNMRVYALAMPAMASACPLYVAVQIERRRGLPRQVSHDLLLQQVAQQQGDTNSGHAVLRRRWLSPCIVPIKRRLSVESHASSRVDCVGCRSLLNVLALALMASLLPRWLRRSC